MRREGRVRGKPTSKSRVTGRCRSGKTRCRSCRDHPVEKSRSKRMGRYKRLAVDVLNNPSLAEFHLQPSLHISSFREILGHEIDEQVRHAGERIYVATVNGVIDAAFFRMRGGLGFNREMEETTTMAFELASGTIVTGDDADVIPANEEAFHREFGSMKMPWRVRTSLRLTSLEGGGPFLARKAGPMLSSRNPARRRTAGLW